jgi:hypothetical protein
MRVRVCTGGLCFSYAVFAYVRVFVGMDGGAPSDETLFSFSDTVCGSRLRLCEMNFHIFYSVIVVLLSCRYPCCSTLTPISMSGLMVYLTRVLYEFQRLRTSWRCHRPTPLT